MILLHTDFLDSIATDLAFGQNVISSLIQSGPTLFAEILFGLLELLRDIFALLWLYD